MAFAALWLGYFGVLQWSVVRFRTGIVITLTVACLALALALARRRRIALGPITSAAALVGSAVIVMTVPLFSYLPAGWERGARAILAASAVVAAAALWRGRSLLAWTAAVGGYVAASAIAIRTDPAPKIDVWVTLQQAADALGRGENFYSVNWVDSPGVQDAFTYLPWTAVLLAPGRWLFGDIRWMQIVWVVVLAAGLYVLGNARALREPRPAARTSAAGAASGRPVPAPAIPEPSRSWTAAAIAALILLAPGTLTQIDQAWTEPLLLTGVVWWAALMARGQAWWAVIPLALACASKQHLAVALPLLLVWRPFGPARAVATGGLAGVLIAPWFLSAPADFIHDTITLLVGFHPIKFANTWYLYFLNNHGITLPFWVTGLVVLGALCSALILLARRQPPIGELVRWVAMVLLAANLVNKQAFYNQYWLCATLVALSLVLDRLPSEQPRLNRSRSADPAATARPDAPAPAPAPPPPG